MRLRTRLTAVLVVTAAALGAASLAAPDTAQARTFWLYRNSISPAWAENPSGVRVTFFNVDSIPHHIASYQLFWSEPWSLDITLAPWQGYTVPDAFTCTYPSCGWEAAYLFRDPDRSTIVSGWGYSYCDGYCGELDVHR